MTYPKWLPQSLTQWLLCIASGALAFILCTLACFVGPWCRDVSPTLATLPSVALSANYAADRSAFASNELVDLTGSATSLIGNSTTHKDGTLFGAVYQVGQLTKAGTSVATAAAGTVKSLAGTARAVTVTTQAIELTANAATNKINNLDVVGTQTRANTVLERISTIPAAVTAALEPLAALENNANLVAANTARATNDLANKEHDLFYPPPCTGKLCPIKKLWRIGRAVMGLAEPAYYGVGIARGQ